VSSGCAATVVKGAGAGGGKPGIEHTGAVSQIGDGSAGGSADGGRSGCWTNLGVHREIKAYGQAAIAIWFCDGPRVVAYERFNKLVRLALLAAYRAKRSALVLDTAGKIRPRCGSLA